MPSARALAWMVVAILAPLASALPADSPAPPPLRQGPDALPGGFCSANGGSGLVLRDRDLDGLDAAYASRLTTAWTADAQAGSAGYQVVASECWLAGDPDDDGTERQPKAHFGEPPLEPTCTPNGGSSLKVLDRDLDGVDAVYASRKTTTWHVGADGEAGLQVVADDCWLAGDPDDDGTERQPGTPEPPVPVALGTHCTPNGGSKVGLLDQDLDGVDAAYAAGKTTEWGTGPDGEPAFQVVASECWLAGDPDDDGTERQPRASLQVSPLEPTCTPNGGSTVRLRDLDRDGLQAAYAAGKATVWAMGPDGEATLQVVASECWLAGDPDDDGAWHLPQVTPPVQAPVDGGCTPNGGSRVYAWDLDGDRLQAVYARGSTSWWGASAARPDLGHGAEPCWLAGDPDDDGRPRAPYVNPPATPPPACTPNQASALRVRDRDDDGFAAAYAEGIATEWSLQASGQPTYRAAAECWLGGDPDDNGQRHVSGQLTVAPPELAFCAPNSGSWPRLLDPDGDGVPALYAAEKSTEWTLQGTRVTLRGTEHDCWLGGDPDPEWSTAAASGHATPPQPWMEETVTLSYRKSVFAADAVDEGLVTVRIAGPENATLEPKGYHASPFGGPADVALDWTWTPRLAGMYTVTFDDRAPSGRSRDIVLQVPVGPARSGLNEGEVLYAYGDSITAAIEDGNARDGSEAYVFEAQRRLGAETADRNLDGRGRSSTWARAELSDHLPPKAHPNTILVIEFGQNDRREERGNLTAAQTVDNLVAMARSASGSAAHVLVALPLLIDPSWDAWYADPAVQRAWLRDIEAGLAAAGVPFVRSYDALDSAPGNGVPDSWDGTHFLDYVHPDAEGHRLLGALIARDIQQRGW